MFWPGLVLVFGFIVGYLLIAPWRCTGTSMPKPGESSTVCRSLIGVTYTGFGDYNPSLVPGLLAGAALSLIAGVGAWWAISRRQGKDDYRHEPDNLT